MFLCLPITQLCKTGVPLSLCIHMEEKGLCFGGAGWMARQSKSEARTKMVHPKKEATKHPRLPTRTKELSEESHSHVLAKK